MKEVPQTDIEEALKFSESLKGFSERKVQLIRKDLTWTVKMIQEGKMKVNPDYVQGMIADARHELTKLNILI